MTEESTEESTDELQHKGLVRTPLYCHDCGKNFVAELDYDINGDHIAECPHCGHEHCRTIKDGVITEARWDGRNGRTPKNRAKRVWKHDVLQIKTSSAAEHIRNRFLGHRWLNRSDIS